MSNNCPVPNSDDFETAVDIVQATSRVLVGVAVRALPEAADVTMAQWRALVVLGFRGEVNVNALAAELGVNPSTCTRLCDRLVAKGLLDRVTSPDSRREVLLRLSRAGQALVRRRGARRRRELEQLVGRLSAGEQHALVVALGPLVRAAGDGAEEAWVLGWAPEQPPVDSPRGRRLGAGGRTVADQGGGRSGSTRRSGEQPAVGEEKIGSPHSGGMGNG